MPRKKSRTRSFKLSYKEDKRLPRLAREAGFESVSDYIRFRIFTYSEQEDSECTRKAG